GTKRRNLEEPDDDSRKKAKMGGVSLNPGPDGPYNPYLAHMYDGDNANGGGNGGGEDPSSVLNDFDRRATTAKQAEEVEDREYNPFTGRRHTQQYFGILKSRRDLPVQKQR